MDVQLQSLKFDPNGLIPAIIQDHTTHQVLMMAWMNLDSLQKTIETGKTHFFSRSRNKRRRKWLPAFSFSQFDDHEPKDPAAPLPDERAELSEQQRSVWDAVGRLSPKLREVAILRYYAGLPYNDIGLVLSIPPKTAESRMRLAHKALREALHDDLDP